VVSEFRRSGSSLDAGGPVLPATAAAGKRDFQKHVVGCDQASDPFYLMQKWIIRPVKLAANRHLRYLISCDLPMIDRHTDKSAGLWDNRF
jgi:hypothetical protein